jgi:ribonuclease P protein component
MNKGEKQTFSKNERLCRIKLIDEVFKNGNILRTSLFKVVWIITGSGIPSPAQVAVSVPRKSFRSAVSRNLIKRRIREAYRKKKFLLYDFLESENTRITFIIIYRFNKVADYIIIENSVEKMIEGLCNDIVKFKKKS